jgi:hypothetical protein
MNRWIGIMALASCAMGAEPAGVGLSVSASSGIPLGLTRNEWLGADSEEFAKLDYIGTSQEGRLTLRPQICFRSSRGKPVDYLELLRKGGPLSPESSHSEVNFRFPALDVKLVNNTKQTVHLSAAVLKVAMSAADPTPLPYLSSGYSQVQCFDFCNEGWDVIDRVQFDFALVPNEPKGPLPETLPFHRTFQRVKESVRISLSDELTKAGVAAELTAAGKTYLAAEAQVEALIEKAGDSTKLDESPEFQSAEKTLENADDAMTKIDPKLAGPFEKTCWLHGRMTLTWKDGTEVRTQAVTFRTDILIFPPDGLGAVGPVSGRYEAMLRDSGVNYELPLDISRDVKAGGIDRFIVTLGIPRTSKHELTLQLKTDTGETLTSMPISIQGLLPRTTASELEAPKSENP